MVFVEPSTPQTAGPGAVAPRPCVLRAVDVAPCALALPSHTASRRVTRLWSFVAIATAGLLVAASPAAAQSRPGASPERLRVSTASARATNAWRSAARATPRLRPGAQRNGALARGRVAASAAHDASTPSRADGPNTNTPAAGAPTASGWVRVERVVPEHPARPLDEGLRLSVTRRGNAVRVRSVARTAGGVRYVRLELRDDGHGHHELSAPEAVRQAFETVANWGQNSFIDPVDPARLQDAVMDAIATQPPTTDATALYERASAGLFHALGDRYSQYYDPPGWEVYNAASQPVRAGYGILTERQGDDLVVHDVERNSPAYRAGVRPGDVVHETWGRPVRQFQWFPRASGSRVRLVGPRGERMRLVFARRAGDGRLEQRIADITSDEYERDIVTSELARGGIGVVRIHDFQSNGTAERMRAAIDDLASRNGGRLAGLVLDLRGNPGGWTHEAHAVLNDFIPEGPLIRYESRVESMAKTVHATPADSRFADLPLVVLVDRDSASSSEIVAGALQDRGRALVVGETTFGKGIAQSVVTLPHGGMKMTTQRMRLPTSDRAYHGAGITPHEQLPQVAGEAGLNAAVDRAIAHAESLKAQRVQ